MMKHMKIYLIHKKERCMINLDIMDLKALEEEPVDHLVVKVDIILIMDLDLMDSAILEIWAIYSLHFLEEDLVGKIHQQEDKDLQKVLI